MNDQYLNVTGPLHAVPFDSLLVQSRDLVCARLKQALASMLNKAREPLEALINGTQDKDLRAIYTEARDGVLGKRKAMEDQFRIQYLKDFEARSGRMKNQGQSFSELDLSTMQLDLVGDDDLKETLKVNDMAGKVRRYCEEELGALDQRVGVLLGDANLAVDDNPFSPQTICDAYKHACRAVSTKVDVRMVLLKLFDDHVLDEIRSIYKAVNELLVQYGILPKIRYSAARSQDGAKTPASAAPANDAGAPTTPAQPAASAPGNEQDFFALLQNVFAKSVAVGTPKSALTGDVIVGFPSLAGLSGAVAPGAGPAVVLQGAELISLLTRVQHDHVKSVTQGDQPSTDAAAGQIGGSSGTTNILHELKSTGVSAGMNKLDNMTLDIVAMLFDQLFDDPRIPIAVKGLIGRMQICFLKVAIAEKEFFSKKTHPARRMLDRLGEISLSLPSDFSSAHPLFLRLASIIQELLDGFENNIEIFDRVRERLQQVVEEEQQRVARETRQIAERIRQTETMAASRLHVQSELRARILGGSLPAAVRLFLMLEWVKVLLVVHAQRGPESEIWKNALSAMDQLVWSARPNPLPEEGRELAKVVPGLLKRLTAGLRIAGVDDAVRDKFFVELQSIHEQTIRKSREAEKATIAQFGLATAESNAAGEALELSLVKTQPIPVYKPQPPADASAAAADSDPVTDATASESSLPEEEDSLDFTEVITIKNPFGEGNVEVKELNAAESGVANEKSRSKGAEFVSGLRVGTWVEFREPDGLVKIRVALLSYISPLRTQFLFVDRLGSDVNQYSRASIEFQFNHAKIGLMENVSFFERIMKAVLGKVR